jgi:hypothetical protein
MCKALGSICITGGKTSPNPSTERLTKVAKQIKNKLMER